MTDPFDSIPGTSASNVSTNDTVLRVDDIVECIKRLPVEPFKKWMIDNGGDPDRGWVLVLPKDEWAWLDNPPQYVRLSTYVMQPMLLYTDYVRPLTQFNYDWNEYECK